MQGTADKETETDALEPDGVVRWRLERLRELGFTDLQRQVLCGIPDVTHTAAALLAAGCPVATCFDLLS